MFSIFQENCISEHHPGIQFSGLWLFGRCFIFWILIFFFSGLCMLTYNKYTLRKKDIVDSNFFLLNVSLSLSLLWITFPYLTFSQHTSRSHVSSSSFNLLALMNPSLIRVLISSVTLNSIYISFASFSAGVNGPACVYREQFRIARNQKPSGNLKLANIETPIRFGPARTVSEQTHGAFPLSLPPRKYRIFANSDLIITFGIDRVWQSMFACKLSVWTRGGGGEEILI